MMLFFSPNGRYLAIPVWLYSDNHRLLWIYDIETKKARMVIEQPIKDTLTVDLKGFKWSANETLLVKVYRLDALHPPSRIYEGGKIKTLPINQEFNGSGLICGMYLCRIKTGNHSQAMKMCLMK